MPDDLKPKVTTLGKIDLSGKGGTQESTKEAEVKPEAQKTASAGQEPVPDPQDNEKEDSLKQETPEENTESGEEGAQSPLKILGKMDLNSLNQQTRPKKKSKDERRREREQRNNNQQQPAQQKAFAQPAGQKRENSDNSAAEAEMIETKVPKLNGPKVLGTIDLSGTDDRRGRRRRIQGQKERIDVNDFNGGGNRQGGKNNNGNQGGNSESGRRDKKKKKGHGKSLSDEDLQREAQDNIRKTRQELSTKLQSSKTSAKHRRDKRENQAEQRRKQEERENEENQILRVTEFVTVSELATMMDVPVNDVIAKCMMLGQMVSINQRMDAETINLVADEFGFTTEYISAEVAEAIAEEEDKAEDLVPRPPVVTVMGHVDHGKTSLLDYIRQTNVIAGEAGGITQHIGAYNVTLADGQQITFLDTPGHEAFTAMRARGAQVADIAIIIVAADDDVMPQTKEALNHASNAGIPIIFAINKIDKPSANPDKIKESLAALNYLVEDWGGNYQCQEIAAKKGTGVNELLEKVILQAELLELKANPNRKASGMIIESQLDKGRGYTSTVLVNNGTLHIGDIVVAGIYQGKIKAMFNERGSRIEEARPGQPAVLLGLSGAPQAGDKFNVMDTEQEARDIAKKREQLQREQDLRTTKHVTLEDIGRRKALGEFHEMNIIVKADVDGTVEALSDSLQKLSTEQIEVKIIHKAVGQISESDVMLAAASDAVIVGFQVRPSATARRMAEQEKIDIRLYSIVYDAIEQIQEAMEGMLSPEIREQITGNAEIRQTFKISKVGTIAGCMVTDGKIKRTSKVRIIREGIVVFTGALASLKRVKDDVKEVTSGLECGLNIEGYDDIQTGDVIEAYDEIEVARKLQTSSQKKY